MFSVSPDRGLLGTSANQFSAVQVALHVLKDP